MFSQETEELTCVLMLTVPETVAPLAGAVIVTALCARAGAAANNDAARIRTGKSRGVR